MSSSAQMAALLMGQRKSCVEVRGNVVPMF